MLCEGVMLYMMLVTVFGNKFNKRRYFFILGWGKCSQNKYFSTTYLAAYIHIYIGPAIPIVAISAGIAHEHYGTDH